MPRSPSQTARDVALLRLVDLYPQVYAQLYDEERLARGLEPLLPRRAERIAELKRELARLDPQTDLGRYDFGDGS